MCADKQGLNGTVNTVCFCSWLSDSVMVWNKVQNMDKRQSSHRQRKQCCKINNKSIDLLSGEYAILIRMDAVA